MKTTAVALVVSVLAHGALILVLINRRVELPAATGRRIEITIVDAAAKTIPAPAVESLPLPLPLPLPGPGRTPARIGKGGMRDRARVAADPSAKVEAEPSTGTSFAEKLERPAILGEIDLELHADPSVTLELDLGPKQKSDTTLKPTEGGGYRHEDSQFTLQIAPDGTIELEDKPNLDTKGPLEPGREKDDPLLEMGGLNPYVQDDAAKETRGGPSVPPVQGVARTGTFDLNDSILRALGDDPNAYEKRKVLRETAELRAELCEQNHVERLRESLLELPAQLEAVWARRDRSTAEKRKLLFTMWDDCAEDGSEQVAKYAEAARATITAFIQRAIPPSHPDAYATDELARLNSTRRSKEIFAPYLSTNTRDAGT